MSCGPCRDLQQRDLTGSIPGAVANNVHLTTMSVSSSVAAADAVGDTCVFVRWRRSWSGFGWRVCTGTSDLRSPSLTLTLFLTLNLKLNLKVALNLTLTLNPNP